MQAFISHIQIWLMVVNMAETSPLLIEVCLCYGIAEMYCTYLRTVL